MTRYDIIIRDHPDTFCTEDKKLAEEFHDELKKRGFFAKIMESPGSCPKKK